MVIGRIYSIKKQDYFYLKYFFQLWRWRLSSGGRSKGLKVFRGMVSYNKNFIYHYNFTYKIWNQLGIFQIFFKTISMNFLTALTFYPKFGFFAINSVEDLHELNCFIRHDTIPTSNYIWGNSLLLIHTKIGNVIFSIQSHKNNQANLARSSGCYGKIIKKTYDKVFVQLPSLKIYIISNKGSATLGLSSKKFLWKFRKAGESIYWGKIPKVRGIAMNPVDHPHGGRTNKGGHPVTPTGFLTKGVKTRKSRGWSKKKIYSPRSKKF